MRLSVNAILAKGTACCGQVCVALLRAESDSSQELYASVRGSAKDRIDASYGAV